MFTSLDLLVVAFIILAVVSFASLCLMFLLKNKTACRVCFFITSALGCYLSWVGFRIGIGGGFMSQMILGILTGFIIIGAIVLEMLSKDNMKLHKSAHIIVSLALVFGICNAFIF